MQKIIEKDLAILAGIATIYRLMRQLGFSYITPRKSHYKQNQKQAEEFKKKSSR